MTATWLLSASLALAGGGVAQPDGGDGGMPPHPEAPVRSLQVQLLAGVWLPRLGGDVAVGGGDIDVATQFNLDEQEATANFELYLRKDEFWEVILSGFGFGASVADQFAGSGSFGPLLLNDGDSFTSSFDINSFAIELAITPWRPYAKGHTHDQGAENRTWDGHYIADLSFSPQFGFRWLDVSQDVASGGSSVGVDGNWFAFMAGLDIALQYRPEIRIPGFSMIELQAGAAGGPALGGEGGFVWQVRAGITINFIEQVGVLIGYRLVEANVENDALSFNGGLQGLFIAGSLTF